MKKYLIIAGVLVVIVVIGAFVVPPIVGRLTHGGPSNQGPQSGGPNCSVVPGEWMPEKGQCPSRNAELDAKCNEFCVKHPDCCGDREGGDKSFGGQERLLSLPSAGDILKLKRIYPSVIKALNEGPNIYPVRGMTQASVISDEKLDAIKDVGFNTIQILLIGKEDNGKLVFNDFNNSILLNDIVAIKKKGLAVWVALDVAGVPTKGGQSLGNYNDFKISFLDFVQNSAKLMEEYKVEYFTAANEPDKPFKEQITKGWNAAEINANLVDFFPAANAVAREEFNGKLINKITKTDKHAKEVLAASLKNIDIAGIDVGPPMDGRMRFTDYQAEFEEYQSYALLAQATGLPWMNAEYWQGDFEGGYSEFAKKNQIKYAQVSFDAYLKAIPKGEGYVWNDWTTFSLPQGEEMKKEMMEFLDKI